MYFPSRVKLCPYQTTLDMLVDRFYNIDIKSNPIFHNLISNLVCKIRQRTFRLYKSEWFIHRSPHQERVFVCVYGGGGSGGVPRLRNMFKILNFGEVSLVWGRVLLWLVTVYKFP